MHDALQTPTHLCHRPNHPPTHPPALPHKAAWVFVSLSPLLLLNTASAGGPAKVIWSDVVGVLMWATGLSIEAIADAQKFKFKMDPANKGRFIDTGLWKYSRCGGVAPGLAAAAAPTYACVRGVGSPALGRALFTEFCGALMDAHPGRARTWLLIMPPAEQHPSEARLSPSAGALRHHPSAL